jgi:hypothetical protein
MSVAEDRPVVDIESIGPATAQALASVGVRTVFDLLRVPEATLVAAVSSVASPEKVRAWVSAALLLQISSMTPQWAEALVSAGIESPGEIYRKNLEAIATTFAHAKELGVIPDIPSPPTIAAMMVDAAILAYTGVIGGTVVDDAGAVVEGANVHAGGASTRTDDRGRFRLPRVPLAQGVRLRIERTDFAPLEISNPHVVSDQEAIELRLYRLTAPTGGVDTHPLLSELAGDAIPLGPGTPFREVVVDADSLSPDDLFRVIESSATDVTVASLLRDYQNGSVIVRKARILRSRIEADATPGTTLRVTGNGFGIVTMSVKEIHRHRIRLRLGRAFADRPAPSTREEARALAAEKLKFLQDAGWFLHGGGGH